MKKVLSILLENESGSLSRVIGLFSQRGYNINSLTVAPTEDSTISRVTIETLGNERTIEQIEKQLHKLINVLSVTEIKNKSCIEREIILIKIKNNSKKNHFLKDILNVFKAKKILVKKKISIIQLTEKKKKINSFLKRIKDFYKIIETTRSGVIGMKIKT